MKEDNRSRKLRPPLDETPEQRSDRLKAQKAAKDARKAAKDEKKAVEDARRLAKFKQLRARLTAECQVRGAPRRFYPFFSESWVSDMRRSEEERPSEAQSEIHQERLIWFYEHQAGLSLYDQLADLMNQDRSDRDYVLSRYQGGYRYYRYAAVQREQATYVSGRIDISKEDGVPVFGHWSHDYDQSAIDPEHKGYVFRHDSNLFFAGWADGVFRLSIARTARGAPSSTYLPGLVLSMRNSTRDPFAARFILVHEHNKELQAALDPELGGERKFEELAKMNPEMHYMLLDYGDKRQRGE